MADASSNIKVAVDAVVFGYSKSEGVQVLLIQRKYPPFKNSWAIPGGFVLSDESLEDAVRRELVEETGIEVNYLEQLYTFGAPKRDPRQRIISIAYFALVKSREAITKINMIVCTFPFLIGPVTMSPGSHYNCILCTRGVLFNCFINI